LQAVLFVKYIPLRFSELKGFKNIFY